MTYRRRSIRLPHYDYTRAGYYFITVSTHKRVHLFGEIEDGVMVLNVAGEMVKKWYDKLEEKFSTVRNDIMVIMPNHIHFVIQIVGADPRVRQQGQHIQDQYNGYQIKEGIYDRKWQTHGQKGQTHGSAPTGDCVGLGDVVQWFKTMTTNTYIQMVKNNTLPSFDKRIWQRNYYEHVVRDANDYARIAEYIRNNPLTWEEDMLNAKTAIKQIS